MIMALGAKFLLFATTALLLSTCAHAEFDVEDFPPHHIDGPHRRSPVDIPTITPPNIPVWPDILTPTDESVASSGGGEFTGGSDPICCTNSWLKNIFSIFNGVFYGDFSFNGVVEGRLAVRGNGVFSEFSVGAPLADASNNTPCVSGSTRDAVLVVGGSTTITSGRVYGGIVINKNKGAAGITNTIQMNPNCFIRQQKPNNLAQAFHQHRQYAITLSTHLLSLTPTLSIQWDDQLWAWKVIRIRDRTTKKFDVLTFPQGVTKVNIGNWKEVVDTILGHRTLIINLPGVEISGNDYNLLKPIADRIIWNWGLQQTSVSIQYVSLYGSVLAPNAAITGSGSLYGQVVAVSSSGFSLHLAPFKGCISAPGLVQNEGALS